MPFVQLDSIELYYEIHGSGRPLVFAHGSGGNHLSWWQQVPFFAKSYTCITFDHRSFGLSKDSDEPLGRKGFVPDLKKLLDHLRIDQVAILAHSMGCRTAVGLTLQHPELVKAIVLCGSNGGSVNDESRIIWHTQQEHRKTLPKGTLRGLSKTFMEQNPEYTFLYRQIMRMNPKHDPDFLAVSPTYRGSTHERLSATGTPILYIVGEDDIISPPRTLEIASSQIPQSRLIRVKDSGHSVYYEQPQLFNTEVMAFLKRFYTPLPV